MSYSRFSDSQFHMFVRIQRVEFWPQNINNAAMFLIVTFCCPILLTVILLPTSEAPILTCIFYTNIRYVLRIFSIILSFHVFKDISMLWVNQFLLFHLNTEFVDGQNCDGWPLFHYLQMLLLMAMKRQRYVH